VEGETKQTKVFAEMPNPEAWGYGFSLDMMEAVQQEGRLRGDDDNIKDGHT
jgi:hypothetical protein